MGVEHISLGTGNVYQNGYNSGYIANAKLDVATEVKKLLAGVPQRTIVSVPVGTTMKLTAGLYEIAPEYMARAMGNQAAITKAGGAQTVLDAANEEHTFREDVTKDEQFIQLGPGPGIAKDFTSVALKNVAESVTYVLDTDYSLDAVTGKVKRLSGGAIASLGTVRAAYGFTQIAGHLVNVGFEQTVTDCLLQFVHTNPRSKKKIHCVIWKAQPDGGFSLDFTEGDFLKTDVAWEALEDASKTSNSLGYIYWET